MAYGIKLYVSGEYACFTRPEMKSERVTYDVMTPSAARGVLEAIYWKPQMRWRVHRIRVLNPICFANIRRNELGGRMQGPTHAQMKGEIGKPLGLFVEDERQQRATLLLRDVAYVIEASVEVVDPRFEKEGCMLPEAECAAKHLEMFKRRARKGQYFHHPYLGCREFAAKFKLLEETDPLPESRLPEGERDRDFGWMLHDIAFLPAKKKDEDAFMESNQKRLVRAEPRFFRAVMKDGIIEVPAFSNATA